ncbi:sensor histidine kinase [Bdellovibrio svalbardensis]|uniref:histidine kinase n=1 Tax=Bdellovibrio svalbardensis TaxID=2972972 RepID=A0ABT6DFS3_9BACT|nr:ATP-binding protein [Bdellovibrio svalbardensis]MDG0815692.1 ATP-binding protein [Bdellovibrio svalbardensis]
MSSDDKTPLKDEFLPSGPQEFKKRRREIIIVLLVSFLFVLLTWFEIRLFATSQQLPFVHSIFFFGLVNFNIVLLLLLLFMIFRNVVKVFVERQGKLFGSSLKAKLIAAFVAFSFVPTVLMFIISVFYINSSFDKWFSAKMAGVLKSSIEVTNAYYFNAKKKNYHFAHQIADAVRPLHNSNEVKNKIETLRKEFSLDAVEYYPSLFGKRIVVSAEDDTVPTVPAVSLEFLQKGIKVQAEASIIHQFGDGNLVRVIVPVKEGADRGAIVVSSFLPLSLVSKMDDISTAYDEFRDINPLEYPLKSIYLIILVLMTFVILLAATWFGFYLAKQLSVPIVQLGRATRRVAGGDYTTLDIKSGSEEINDLIASFNQMTVTLEKTLEKLDEHARYTDTVLKNVNTGVISVDQSGMVSTINRRAAQLLKVDPEKHIGYSVRDLLTLEYFRTFAELLKNMQDNKVESIQKELRINVHGEAIPLQMSLSILKDEKGQEVGKILVFDDMTPLQNAQRAAAWTEVARRIAHEIKNPLTPIKLSAERLQRKFGASITDPAFNECTTMIVKQVDGLKNLVNEFSNFARLPQARPVVANLNSVVEESLGLYRQAHPQVHFDFAQDFELPDFKFDPDQIKRVLVNLVDNAVSAVAKEPQPTVQIITRYDRDIKTVRLTVADNGEGIPAADRNRIFEPYYSTKESGTGLGLAIVKRIIEDHNGFIRATANEPKGVKMVIEMPVNEVGAWKPSEE